MKENSLGIKTLAPFDERYVSYYDNGDDSGNFWTSHGYSYHNGPVFSININSGMGMGVRQLPVGVI